jgi:hypothetical protein
MQSMPKGLRPIARKGGRGSALRLCARTTPLDGLPPPRSLARA